LQRQLRELPQSEVLRKVGIGNDDFQFRKNKGSGGKGGNMDLRTATSRIVNHQIMAKSHVKKKEAISVESGYTLDLRRVGCLTMAVSKITLHIIVEKDTESGWFTASCPALPGCVTQAETEAELFDNIKEAVTLWLEAQDEKVMLARHNSSSDNSSNIQELALSI